MRRPPSTSSSPICRANNRRGEPASVIQCSRPHTTSSHPSGLSPQAEQVEVTSSPSNRSHRTARTRKSLLHKQLWRKIQHTPLLTRCRRTDRGRCRRAHQPEPPKSSSSRSKCSHLIMWVGVGTQPRGKDQRQLMSTHSQNNSLR